MSTILLSCSFPKSSNENKPNNENVKQGIEKAEKDFVIYRLSKTITFNGIFHTVWKKQRGGSWQYVWD